MTFNSRFLQRLLARLEAGQNPLDLVPREIILRSGDDMATLVNEGPLGGTNADGTAQSATGG